MIAATCRQVILSGSIISIIWKNDFEYNFFCIGDNFENIKLKYSVMLEDKYIAVSSGGESLQISECSGAGGAVGVVMEAYY